MDSRKSRISTGREINEQKNNLETIQSFYIKKSRAMLICSYFLLIVKNCMYEMQIFIYVIYHNIKFSGVGIRPEHPT